MPNNDQAITELKSLLGDRLSTAQSVLNLHGENETYFDIIPPDAVAFPNDTAEVSEIVKICNTHGCPVCRGALEHLLKGTHCQSAVASPLIW